MAVSPGRSQSAAAVSATVTGGSGFVHLNRRVRELDAATRAASLLLQATEPQQTALTTAQVLAEALRSPRLRLVQVGGSRSTVVALCVEGSPALPEAAPATRAALPPGARTATASFVDDDTGNAVVPIRTGDALWIAVGEAAIDGYGSDDLAAADRIAALAATALANAASRAAQECELRRLRDSDASKSRFLDVTAHELRGPLTVVTGYLSLLEDGALGEVPPRLAELLPVIYGRVAEMDGLLASVLETCRIDDDRLQLSPEVIDVREVVDEAARRCQVFAQPGQHVGVRCAGEPIVVRGDRDRLRTIVFNLVHNALRYSPGRTDVQITVEATSEAASVAVSDLGIGMTPAELAGLFVRFGRGRIHPDVRSAPGIGLGLYVARELARAHGGDIAVASSPGAGSTFTLTLPLLA